MPLSELEQEFFNDILVQEPIVEEIPAIEEKPVVVEEIIAEKPIIEETKPEPIIEEVPAPYKSKKFIEVSDEKELYNTLNKKYQYESMSADAKAIAFIKQQNPSLSDEDIAFTAMSEYGIGLDAPADDELTDEQKIGLRKQDIARKKLISQADDYFKTEAEKVALEDYDPLDLDPDYKAYRSQVQAQQEASQKQQIKLTEINTALETNAKSISEITESIDIDIDGSKFTIPVKFNVNTDKQKQLEDFAKRYQPTPAEYETFNNPETGKFDYKGYLESLAPICFARDMYKAAVRQALTTDRDNFIQKELKNSTLRNNDVAQTVEKPFDLVDAWKFGN